jgi:taurine dioxygenase
VQGEPAVEPVSGALGAEITGVDLARLDDSTWERVRELWLEHLVVFFPGQHLAPDEHVSFARRLGTPEIHPFLAKLDEAHQEIVVLDSEQGARADTYHTDVTFSPTPPMASVLNMVVLPASGGDTIWTNQHAAYDALSPALRRFVDGLTAVHSAAPFGRPEIEVVHPVVRVHPETGRPSLFVNRAFTARICELDAAESAAVLALLYSVSEQPFLQCRYRWSEGTIAVWDNRCTQHYAVGDYTTRRVIQRVTILGDEPRGPSDPAAVAGAPLEHLARTEAGTGVTAAS